VSNVPRVLIVDDEEGVVEFLSHRLESAGYEVLKALGGKEGLEVAKAQKPHIIILDVMMPFVDGYQVCRELKDNPDTRYIKIMLLTANTSDDDIVKGLDIGADDYVTKPVKGAIIEARVKALLRSLTAPPPYDSRPHESVLRLSCHPDHKITIRTSDMYDVSSGLLKINGAIYGRQGNNIPLGGWRSNSNFVGTHLFQSIFADHPEVLGSYQNALGRAQEDENLHLHFEGFRDFLQVPLESLFNSVFTSQNHLILRHPLSRCVMSAPWKRSPLSPQFLNELWSRNEPLKILLIASNTQPPIPGVDREITALSNFLSAAFKSKGLEAQVETITTSQATYGEVKKVLLKCPFHIVHYAGHGAYNQESPEKSFILLRDGEHPSLLKQMTVETLGLLLQGSAVRFVYLSCCEGSKTGSASALLDDDFLGIAEGIINAGVPSVLGFRWPVSDDGAITLAKAFYESLIKHGHLDTALLEARREVAMLNRNDITWLSPILIMQT
jgi:CheY-like chemotaxis protein